MAARPRSGACGGALLALLLAELPVDPDDPYYMEPISAVADVYNGRTLKSAGV